MTIIEAMDEVFGEEFGGSSWDSWRVLLRALFGLTMSDADLELYTRCTGRTRAPSGPCREGWVPCGRRAGKSRIAALVAVYLAAFRKYDLAPGERGTVMLLAADRKQSRVCLRYVKGLLAHPLLAPLVERETAEAIDLRGNVSIEVATGSHRTIRGYTVVAAVLDEVAFWRSDESAQPDQEIVAALRPALSTVPGSILVGISSPYSRRGILWRQHQRHYGREDSATLIWRAGTRLMNPTIPTEVIEEARAEDPTAAASEWDAEFRNDLESLFDLDSLAACVVPDQRELPPLRDLHYQAFVDPSGGRADSFTLGIGHLDGERAIVDLLRGWKAPFNPSGVVEEIVAILREYRVSTVVGDRYGGEFPREMFRSHGVNYDLADRVKSDLYLSLLSTVNSKRIDLPDDNRLLTELRTLERRRGASGRDKVDHPVGGRDDHANALAGLAHLLLGRRRCTWEDLYPKDEIMVH